MAGSLMRIIALDDSGKYRESPRAPEHIRALFRFMIAGKLKKVKGVIATLTKREIDMYRKDIGKFIMTHPANIMWALTNGYKYNIIDDCSIRVDQFLEKKQYNEVRMVADAAKQRDIHVVFSDDWLWKTYQCSKDTTKSLLAARRCMFGYTYKIIKNEDYPFEYRKFIITTVDAATIRLILCRINGRDFESTLVQWLLASVVTLQTIINCFIVRTKGYDFGDDRDALERYLSCGEVAEDQKFHYSYYYDKQAMEYIIYRLAVKRVITRWRRNTMKRRTSIMNII